MKIRIATIAGAVLMAGMLHAQNNNPAPQLGKASIDEVISAMTLEEKAKLLVGDHEFDYYVNGTVKDEIPDIAGTSAAIPRLGIPVTYYTDGPAGVNIAPTRKGTDKTFYCTAFPVATMLASTWNPGLVHQVGEAIGNEALEYGCDVVLAPAINLHRNPLCGRNFEYYSEDPVLIGKTASAMISGIQSNGVGTSLKHFAANNQETFRRENDSRISQRALRELYLRGFEIAVRESHPWTIMSAYNLINGTACSESYKLLTTILRDEWGFNGFVMTDWVRLQIRDIATQIHAGNEMMMPGYPEQIDQVVAAVKEGRLAEADLDLAVKRMLEVIVRTPRFKGYKFSNDPDLAAHAEITRTAANEGIILLKNEGFTLPLSDKSTKIALFGCGSYDLFAGGLGSGEVNAAKIVNIDEGLRNYGFSLNKELESIYQGMKQEIGISPKYAALRAEDSDVAIVTIRRNAGEYVDRRAIKGDFYLDDVETYLLKNVSEAFHARGKKVIVILNTGGVIETASWKDLADAIVLPWQPGVEGGNTIADILTGKVNPSGKLTMTWPVEYMDIPSSKNFPYDFEGNSWKAGPVRDSFDPNKRNIGFTEYEEGIWVGYRYFSTYKIPVSFPFGYGLSYTTFSYSEPKVRLGKKGLWEASVKVTNTGSVSGKEVVELYVTAPESKMEKPVRELKAFGKTGELAPGESQTVTLTFTTDDLASFDEARNCWVTDAGTYEVHFAASSDDLRQSIPIKVRKSSVRTVLTKLD
ncbi:MAG: glycoside hydrolase family 3 C-terminal domain-containing protein [Bacteroidales bacterium]|nr:glycoside hydrolase family 3 C-terminal domain-containing protein [Bacteroidales bacterium]